MKPNAVLTENRLLGVSSIRKLLPTKYKGEFIRTRSISDVENTPPIDRNVPVEKNEELAKSINKTTFHEDTARSNTIPEAPQPADSAVKVVVRIKPADDHEKLRDQTVRKVSPNSLMVGDRRFSFDSVLDANSSQDDVFRSVGVPVVKSALAGFNNSMLSYGQTGSGKTYTMWGPPSAMVEGHSNIDQQGIVPRIFQMLFSEIQREQQNNSAGEQKNYQCRCSFLEIHNEKIGDLIDPAHRDLEIKDDPKNGFYVENLTEDYVASYEDVMQILIKGLSNRKVGATSINSKSSRSHVVFTFIIEFWCKGNSSTCFSSSKTSRVSFVDLAGLDRTHVDDASTLDEKEGKNVKKSLSQLGHLVKILAEGARSGKLENVPYRNSCLTHILQESLGGNAKLSIICTVTPEKRCASETLSALRFGQRAKAIHNHPVINEITEDAVNDLSDQIRQLKEELVRVKSSGSVSVNSSRCFQGRNVRDSLNQLRVTLNRSLVLPKMDNDLKEEVNFNEDDVKELRVQLETLGKRNNCEPEARQGLEEPDVLEQEELPPMEEDDTFASSLQQTGLQGPTLTESPKFSNTQRKSTVFISNSLRQKDLIRSGPSESLATSIQRGLQIIEQHQEHSNSSSVSFSFGNLTLRPCAADTADASVQTLLEEKPKPYYLCASCQKRGTEEEDRLKKWNVSVDNSQKHDGLLSVAKETPEAAKREDIEKICMEQEAKIEELNRLVEQYKHQLLCNSLSKRGQEIVPFTLEKSFEGNQQEIIKEVLEGTNGRTLETDDDKEALLKEIQALRNKMKSYEDENPNLNKSLAKLRSSFFSHSNQWQRCGADTTSNGEEELEKERERERWTQIESDWISLTDELRIDLESHRRHTEKVEKELTLQKRCTEEHNDELRRAILGHARMVEHYVELQEKHNEMVEKHRVMMEGITEVKRAAQKAGTKGHGSRFAKALAAELSAMRLERDRETKQLKKENKSLRIQLKDTAEAVHAAGELLVRLREAEEAAAIAEEHYMKGQQANEKLKKQLEKVKGKHKMEMITMKQYLEESRLPESALRPLYTEDSDLMNTANLPADDDQAWRAEFGATYNHY